MNRYSDLVSFLLASSISESGSNTWDTCVDNYPTLFFLKKTKGILYSRLSVRLSVLQNRPLLATLNFRKFSFQKGSKGQISLNFNYKINFKFFIPNFECVLTNEIYSIYRTRFAFSRLGHAQGVELGGAGGVKKIAWGFSLAPHRLRVLVNCFACVFDALRPSQQFPVLSGRFPDQVPCSRTQYIASSKSGTWNSSISNQPLYNWATALFKWTVLKLQTDNLFLAHDWMIIETDKHCSKWSQFASFFVSVICPW